MIRWIDENPTRKNKREIAKEFGIKGAARIDLKRMLKELTDEGLLEKRKHNYVDPSDLPPVMVLVVTRPDKDGDVFAAPMDWQGDGVVPRVLMMPQKGDPALGNGDRVLVRLSAITGQDHAY